MLCSTMIACRPADRTASEGGRGPGPLL